MLALVLVWLTAVPEPSLGQSLRALASTRVLVAHQLVGQNVLDGVSVLAYQNAVPLRIDEKPFTGAGILHAWVGPDGSPLGKLRAFVALLEESRGVQVAWVELSYADLNADTDPNALFIAFQSCHDALKIRFPQVRFLIATVGLTTVQRGLQGMLKNKTASGAFGELQNVKRHQFNQLLRARYGGSASLFFDLAAVTSSGCSFERDGKQWPCLLDGLTDDGGHLNALGRKRAGRAFIDAVAAAL